MAKFCPIIQEKVVYLTCLECETKECKEKTKSKYSDDTEEVKENRKDE